jgi:hypothetical protein
MKSNTGKSEVMAFKGRNPIQSKICLNNKIIEQVNMFKYLGYSLSYRGEIDIQAKITNFIKVTHIINSVLNLNPVERHTRLRVYNVLAKPTVVYGSDAWTVKKQYEK